MKIPFIHRYNADHQLHPDNVPPGTSRGPTIRLGNTAIVLGLRPRLPDVTPPSSLRPRPVQTNLARPRAASTSNPSNAPLPAESRAADQKRGARANPSKVESLGYFRHEKEWMQIGGGATVYRKQPDSALFGGPNQYGEQPVSLPGHSKHSFFKTGNEFEYMSFVETPTPGRRSYQLAMDETLKVVGYGGDAAGGPQYPHATGTSKPGVVCVTDGMAVCTAVVVGGTSADQSKAHIKVFHIQPDINVGGVQAITDYMEKMRSRGLTDFKVAMHGGNFYKQPVDSEKIDRERVTTEQLRQLFDKPDVTVEIDEVSDRRGDKYTCLGAVIEKDQNQKHSIRLINELVEPST